MQRGQAALEFLTTYGWAFMVILIMISALGYFGVLDPGQLVPERCQVGQAFECESYRLVENSTGTLALNMSVINRQGSAMNVTGTAIDNTSAEVNNGGSCSVTNNPVQTDQRTIIECTGISGSFPGPGSKQQLDFEFSYKELGAPFGSTVTGSVLATIEQ